MDPSTNDLLRRKVTTRREARSGLHCSAKEDAAWAETLDWQGNDHDVSRLCWRLFEQFDLDYRARGLRLDQLADQQELRAAAQRAVAWYRQAEPQYRVCGIYEYVRRELELLLNKKATRLT